MKWSILQNMTLFSRSLNYLALYIPNALIYLTCFYVHDYYPNTEISFHLASYKVKINLASITCSLLLFSMFLCNVLPIRVQFSFHCSFSRLQFHILFIVSFPRFRTLFVEISSICPCKPGWILHLSCSHSLFWNVKIAQCSIFRAEISQFHTRMIHEFRGYGRYSINTIILCCLVNYSVRRSNHFDLKHGQLSNVLKYHKIHAIKIFIDFSEINFDLEARINTN